jgi:hypothetical protein
MSLLQPSLTDPMSEGAIGTFQQLMTNSALPTRPQDIHRVL